MGFSLPENCKIVQMASPETTNTGKTSDTVSLKNVHMCWIVIDLSNTTGHATLFTPTQATDVASGTNAVLATAIPIWLNEDCAASDLLVRQTDGLNETVGAVAKDKQIVFQIDPAGLTAGYDCVYVVAADSSQAGNFWNCTAYLLERYAADQPPSAIID